MSLHLSQGPISLGKGNHFLFCLLSCEMEEDAAEVRERQMDITLTFEEWKANKRVTGEEGKLNLLFQRFFLYIRHSFHVQCPNDRRLVNREVKNREVRNRLSNDIFLYTCRCKEKCGMCCGIRARASHKATTRKITKRGRGEKGSLLSLSYGVRTSL